MEVHSEESGVSMETVTRNMVTTMESSSVSSYSSNVQISQDASQSVEPGPVDENANAIEAPVADAPAEISQENIKTQLQEIISEIEQNVGPEDEEEVTKEQEDAVKSLVEQELKLMQEEEALLAQQQKEEEEVKKVEEEVVVVKSEEFKEVETDASVMKEEELKAMEAERAAVADGESSSNELWNVEGVKVTFPHDREDGYYEEYDENGQPLYHTWRPKGKYEMIKTEVKHADITPMKVDDPKLTEVPISAVPAQQPAVVEDPAFMTQNGMQVDMQPLTNGFCDELSGLSPGLDIPAGIPLLARILPKDSTEVERKISLERLFTPATDSPDLTPTRNKKVFSSSAFYRPDHPTIEDQVDLAQRISNSLINDDNKMSRGQTMYIKRKKRSVRWIHQEEGIEYEEDDDEGAEIEELIRLSGMQGPHGPGLVEVFEPDSPQQTPGERGPMKLMMSSKHQQVDQVYQTSEMESPSGKGAELFAKRKKRMDKFIVDENTVQQSQEAAAAIAHQQTSVVSSSSVAQSSSTTHTQQQQIMVGGAYAGPTNITYGSQGVAAGGDVIYTAECKIVQRSHPPTPQFDLPASGGLLSDLTTDDKQEKRKSFNLAAKGFGTYQNFYTPIHLGKAC